MQLVAFHTPDITSGQLTGPFADIKQTVVFRGRSSEAKFRPMGQRHSGGKGTIAFQGRRPNQDYRAIHWGLAG